MHNAFIYVVSDVTLQRADLNRTTTDHMITIAMPKTVKLVAIVIM